MTEEEREDKMHYLDRDLAEYMKDRVPTRGFMTPILVSMNMHAFFTHANLGNDHRDPESNPINSHLLLVQEGISTPVILRLLFMIYIKVNKVQHPDNKNLLCSNAEMDKYFTETYEVLTSRPPKYDKGKPLPGFDPKEFNYPSLTSIILNNVTKDSNVSHYFPILEKERIMLSEILKFYILLNSN